MRTIFLALLANYGCVAGAPNPEGDDWAPLSGQAGTGVSTSPEEAGAASGGADAEPPAGGGETDDASAAEAVAEVGETVAQLTETVVDLTERLDALTEVVNTEKATVVGLTERLDALTEEVNTEKATVVGLTERLDTLTELVRTESGYIVTVENYGEVPIVISCDAETDLLVRWAVVTYGTLTYQITYFEESTPVETTVVWAFPVTVAGDDGVEAFQTMEASQVELHGESMLDYYTRSFAHYYHASVTIETPAIFEGLCLPLGE